MNPLLSNRELEKEGTEEEGKHVFHLSVREHVHNDTQRVAKEQTESVVDRLGIETGSLRKTLDIAGNKCGDCCCNGAT